MRRIHSINEGRMCVCVCVWSTQGNTKVMRKTCCIANLSTTNPKWMGMESNLGLHGDRLKSFWPVPILWSGLHSSQFSLRDLSAVNIFFLLFLTAVRLLPSTVFSTGHIAFKSSSTLLQNSLSLPVSRIYGDPESKHLEAGSQFF